MSYYIIPFVGAVAQGHVGVGGAVTEGESPFDA